MHVTSMLLVGPGWTYLWMLLSFSGVLWEMKMFTRHLPGTLTVKENHYFIRREGLSLPLALMEQEGNGPIDLRRLGQ